MIVVGVVFQSGGRVEVLDPNGVDLAWNDRVICEAPRGEEYGRVVEASHELEGRAPERVFRVLRKATPEDDALRREQRERAAEVRRAFRRAVVERHPRAAVKVHAAEMPFDGRRVVIGFTAEERLDLQPLAREVGQRLGVCIRDRMAKDQDLPVNPGRVTGLCGRLRCCLAFEHPLYRSFRDRAPAIGRTVDTPEGRGVVRGVQVPADAVVVRLADDREVAVRLDDVSEVRR